MRGIQVAGPERAARREGSAECSALLRQLTFLVAGELEGGEEVQRAWSGALNEFFQENFSLVSMKVCALTVEH